jgi:hypothetical protein
VNDGALFTSFADGQLRRRLGTLGLLHDLVAQLTIAEPSASSSVRLKLSHQQTQGDGVTYVEEKGRAEEIAPLLFCFVQELLQLVLTSRPRRLAL